MLRHEYVDHVAALVLAHTAPAFGTTGAERHKPAECAAYALAVATALADLRYPASADEASPPGTVLDRLRGRVVLDGTEPR